MLTHALPKVSRERFGIIRRNDAHAANQERARSLKEALLKLASTHGGRWSRMNALLYCKRDLASGWEETLDSDVRVVESEVDFIAEYGGELSADNMTHTVKPSRHR